PMAGAGNQIAQIRHHLATVAHAETERGIAREETFELRARAAVEQNGFGPALAGTQDVAIRKTTTGGQRIEIIQTDTAADDVAHMHVDGVEAGAVESCRHFHLAVDALFTQYRNAWPRAALDVR